MVDLIGCGVNKMEGRKLLGSDGGLKSVRWVFKSRGPCDSFPGEGKVGVSQTILAANAKCIPRKIAAKPLPATTQAAAPLPWEGILKSNIHSMKAHPLN
jgi:hypothetical protein